MSFLLNTSCWLFNLFFFLTLAHLAQSARQSKKEDVVQDARVTFRKTQELPHLTGPQHSCTEHTHSQLNLYCPNRLQFQTIKKTKDD